jgi:aminopeptidase N
MGKNNYLLILMLPAFYLSFFLNHDINKQSIQNEKPKSGNIEISKYQINLQFDPETQTFSATSAFQARLAGKTENDLPTFNASDFIKIEEIRLNGSKVQYNIRNDRNMILYSLDRKLPHSKVFSVFVRYSGISYESFPCLDSKIFLLRSEAFPALFKKNKPTKTTAAIEMSISLPIDWTCLATGNQSIIETKNERELYKWTWNDPDIPLKDAFITIFKKPEKIVRTNLKNTKISLYYFKIDSEEADKILQIAARAMDFYIDIFGPCCFQEVSLLLPPDQKYSDFCVHNVAVVSELLASSQSQHFVNLLSHEISHFWHGRYFKPSPCYMDEGFAEYSALLFVEKYYGRAIYNKFIHDYMDAISKIEPCLVDQVVKESSQWYYKTEMPQEFFVKTQYQKISMILHVLRYYLGEIKFFQLLHEYYTTLGRKDYQMDNFINLVSKIAGEDYKFFFEQWLFRTEFPLINYSYNLVKDKNGLSSLNLRFTQPESIFKIPLEIKIITQHESTIKRINLETHEDFFQFPLGFQEFKAVKIDPEQKFWNQNHCQLNEIKEIK